MSIGYELGGDSGLLSALADTQIGHRGQFEAILNDVKSQTAAVLGNWEGAGWDEKDADGKNFDDHYQQAQEAFQRLINATDENASSIAALAGRMISRFS
ncbi:uncharacterized protein YukE [Stackebrandtia albiflava]|uniref:Uncharacterized protein YukE n=1 Tax=Stackebrandtia albiflava TaxID=406432 RepID=A0A562UXX4_9ACTN|nr:hypothetical protein [Stackebrandtia albiflava]TWJ10500.1 uncharacterized protein YukE [Stackebrandtia albiflava]